MHIMKNSCIYSDLALTNGNILTSHNDNNDVVKLETVSWFFVLKFGPL